MRALGDEETRRAVEVAHERAIAAVLAWIEDEAVIVRVGVQGVCKVCPVHGLVAARFRRHEARSGMPLLYDHLLHDPPPSVRRSPVLRRRVGLVQARMSRVPFSWTVAFVRPEGQRDEANSRLIVHPSQC
ncbi:relaxase domain-containing protein [Streptomyces sp. NPDC088812]|uniref:relaxase domain-containing protein n=1 Tax=Streptomyces sp. NPDC088812 TaxID=3365905 RepID=UPI003803342A